MTNPHVRSVNVSQRTVVDWRGQQIETGFYKTPVPGPVSLRGVNLTGDDQADRAVHGGRFKAVYAYPHEHYARWHGELTDSVLDPGSFGENLTVSGVLEEDVACGDILHIGSAALIVTEPRVPCWKLAMRFGKDDMPAVFARRGLTGWYTAVHYEGSVAAGDAITIEHTSEPRITMRQLADIRSRPGEADPALLDAARHLPWLTSEWHDFIERLLHRRLSPKPAPPAPRLDVRIAGRRPLGPDVVELELAPATGEQLPAAAPGQFIALSLDGRHGRRATRCYSLCGPPESDRWLIAIKQVPDTDHSSPLISHRMRELPIGQVLDAAAPAGSFTLDLHEPGRPLVLIGAGIGVTPIISMLRAILANPAPRQDPVIVVHACQSPERELYTDVFQQAHSTPGVTVHTFCLNGGPPAAGRAHVGLLDADRLLELVPSTRADFFVCGPPALTSSLREGLLAKGMPLERFHTEAFGPTAARATHIARSGPCEVTFDQSSYTILSTDPAETILDIAERYGIQIESSCRSGSCGTCATAILDGDVAYPTEPTAPHSTNTVITCLAIPTTNVVIDA
jgi:MOSC domain-containing protein YiiM/ferredoxin-NADP reductase